MGTVRERKETGNKSANAHQGAPFGGWSSGLEDLQRFRRDRVFKEIVTLPPFVGGSMVLFTSPPPGGGRLSLMLVCRR